MMKLTEAQRNFIFAWSMPLAAAGAFLIVYTWASDITAIIAAILLGITLDTALEGICLFGFLNGSPLEFPLQNPTKKSPVKTEVPEATPQPETATKIEAPTSVGWATQEIVQEIEPLNWRSPF